MKNKVDLSNKQEREKYWNDKAVKTLQGRIITAVRYLKDDEAEQNMWSKKGVVLVLDNGTTIIPAMDDEFNDTGVLHYIDKGGKWDCLPSL